MGKILMIDDDPAFLRLIDEYIEETYPNLEVITCSDPLRCLTRITTDLDLLLVDLEMPGLDGSKILAYATSIGLNKNKVIIVSGRDADYLHEKFPIGSCLAVLNKNEGKQKRVLDMVFKSLQQKSVAKG
jgi:CheY-like chemotaxis protein